MPRPPSCLSPPLLLLLFLLHHASSAAFLTLPLPLQQHRSSSPSSIIASPASSSPTHSPYSSQNLVVVVVNEKITRFYHHLLLPPFSSLNPPVATFTHVQPPDPYNFEQHDGRGHPRDRGKYQGSSYSHSTHIGQPQSKPGRSSHWPGQDHYFRTIEQQIGDAEEVLVVGHGKGKGEAADLLLNDLAKTKPYLRSKVKGLVRVDDTHLTHRQILQLVRKIVVGHEDPRKERVIHGQPLPPPGRK